MDSFSSEESSDGYTESSLQKEYFYDKESEESPFNKGKVILYHGPYEFIGYIRHRERKLRILKDLLENSDYYVEYKAWEHYNRMGVLINDKLIFTCRMTDLDYDGFGKNPSSKRAFEVAMKILKRIDAWYIIKYFTKPAPYEYFSLSFGH